MPIDAKLLKTGILALSLTATATVGLAADYEIFGDFMSVATGENHYSVERLDHKNRKRYHCTAVLDAKTRQLTGQCTERPGFPENPTGKEPNAQGAMSTRFGGMTVLGFGRSTRLPEKPSSVFQALFSAWR